MAYRCSFSVPVCVYCLSGLLVGCGQPDRLFSDVNTEMPDFAMAEQAAAERLAGLNRFSPPNQGVTNYRMVRINQEVVSDFFDRLASVTGATDGKAIVSPRTDLGRSFEFEPFPGTKCIIETVNEGQYFHFDPSVPLRVGPEGDGAWIYVSECEGQPLWATGSSLRFSDGRVRFELRPHYRDDSDGDALSLYDGPTYILATLEGTQYAFVYEQDGDVAYILSERPQ